MEDRYNFNDKENLIKDIKQLQGYDGYVQFSDTKIRSCDIFHNENIATKINPTDGFVYEAHFYNKDKKESIQIRQINDSWIVSTTTLDDKEFDITEEEFIADIQEFPYKVKMAQLWKAEPDEYCAGMDVKKLKKVVFAGFVKGGKNYA